MPFPQSLAQFAINRRHSQPNNGGGCPTKSSLSSKLSKNSNKKPSSPIPPPLLPPPTSPPPSPLQSELPQQNNNINPNSHVRLLRGRRVFRVVRRLAIMLIFLGEK
ncbi:unnamed protein product [Meloidogyne enterolobii]|uniref:Uncharacterized protein n=1 Tax=Meloidogyne enterolobii TaxID=390850 RepID=A0ACB1A4Y2_MELEN